MTPDFFKILRHLFFIGLLISFKYGNAQVKYEQIAFRIDSLASIGLPASALKEVEKLDAMAHADNNASQQVRSVIYRITFQAYLEDNAFVPIIRRLNSDIDQAKYPVKPVLQSLLAQFYWSYYKLNRYRFGQRTESVNRDTDFTAWDLKTILNQTSRLYELSLADAVKEQNTPMDILDGVLEGDKETRYLRPTLYDLLVNRAFDFFLSDEAAINQPRMPFTLNDPRLFGDSHTFVNLVIKTADTTSIHYKGLKYLQRATAFHLLQDQQEAVADLDLKRVQFLYLKSNIRSKDSVYTAALDKIAASFSGKPISAEAAVLVGQYYQRLDSLATAYIYFKKAATAYPNSFGGRNAAVLIRQLKERQISARVESVNMPGRPLLALINYRNISSANVIIYRLSENQFEKYQGTLRTINDYVEGYNDLKNRRFDYLKKLIPLRSDTLSWKAVDDYRSHSLEFKIESLKPGNYVLMVKYPSSEDKTLTGLTDFKISRLASCSRKTPDGNTELRVMDRENGTPISGVQINIASRTYKYNATKKTSDWENITESGLSDKAGLFISKKTALSNNVAVDLKIKGDTLTGSYKSVFGAQEYDDDEPQDKTILFADRQIYRPGQTIYFKGIQLQTLQQKSKIIAGKAVAVDFEDVNGKTISTLNLTTNDFGTFSGSFIIPQTMVNGDVTLRTEDGALNVKVEEYKRPTFQVAFVPVKDRHRLNDTVSVKGTVMAFSGYGLTQAKVAYHITRSQYRIIYDYQENPAIYRSGYRYNPVESEIAADTITTNDQGRFEIKFKAIPGDGDQVNDINYTYSISADVTDASNETRSAQTSVTVGDKDILIVDNLPPQLFVKDTISTSVSINNLNGQPQNGAIRVEIFALQNADHAFKDRLWPKPDQIILSRADFMNNFPFYAYGNEDVVAQWPRIGKVVACDIKIDTGKTARIDLDQLKKQQPGIYQVVIRARNENGDTVSVIKYINLVEDHVKTLKFDNWVTPVLTVVKPGQEAAFLVGIDKKINVLVERYSKAKLLSSNWITIEKGQKNIKIPISDTDKNVALQFMMLYQNRLFSSYQQIYISKPDKNLKIKFLTFRNKLEPGEKEVWKLQVSGQNKDKEAVEMLAGLYDASLDDITPPQNWNQPLDQSETYQPNYFAWTTYDFIDVASTIALSENQTAYSINARNYEKLNLFGYDYYGGYNNGYQAYLQNIKAHLSNVERDKRIAAEYKVNAEKIKNGYDITGRVTDANDGGAIPGAIVAIKGLSITTLTNSQGYFRIKVPVNAKLTIKLIGYQTKEVQTIRGKNLEVTLREDARELREVAVVGYKAQNKREITQSVSTVTVRGISTIANGLAGKIAGVQIAPAPPAFDKELVGRRRTPVLIRTNFNETAFFYPQLRTNEKGEILIEFTIPEALTRWKFRGLAHTKDLQTGYIENEVITQKQFSVSANTPRFLREGDTSEIAVRVSNLDKKAVNGVIKLQLFNALNMQPVNLLLYKTEEVQQFNIKAQTNTALIFHLIIPKGLDALTYRLTAEAGKYSDGEENTLPVLPSRALVIESMPMVIRAGQIRNFRFDRFVDQNSLTLQNKALTLEYTQNPAWYAVEALPYMMEFPYECSEQIFSRFYANSLATGLIKRMPAIKRIFDQWNAGNSTELLSNLEKNQELKSILIEETPWLRDAMSETEQKKRIALLFDLNRMSSELKLNIDKLQKKQLPDGGFPWFGENTSDRFITQHILTGIGELYHLGVTQHSPEMDSLISGGLRYLDNHLIRDNNLQNKNYASRTLSPEEIHAWFARSYFFNKSPGVNVRKLLSQYLDRASNQWISMNVYEQSMIALTLQRYNRSGVTQQIERSLLETAQHSVELGMYWPKNKQGCFWYESPVETQSLLISLFTEIGNNTKAIDEMKIWLLRNKQTNNWGTTKATAAACYALLLKGDDLLKFNNGSVIKLGGKPLEDLKPVVKAEAGTGYIKASWADEQIKPELGKIEIKNTGATISWGAMHWQYLENFDKITPSQTNIKLDRKYFIQKLNDNGAILVAVDATHQPKAGDLLKVVIHFTADRNFEYVQLKDLRPAGTEPVEAISAYKYQDGLYYYQVNKDVATNFFINYLNSGNYVFEYQLRVTQPGNFSTGITTVQSMYAPEFNAHSNGGRITIRP